MGGDLEAAPLAFLNLHGALDRWIAGRWPLAAGAPCKLSPKLSSFYIYRSCITSTVAHDAIRLAGKHWSEQGMQTSFCWRIQTQVKATYLQQGGGKGIQISLLSSMGLLLSGGQAWEPP